MRRAARGLANVLIVAGVLLVIDAAVTVLWQEPLTALYAKARQGSLGGDLDRLDRAQPSQREVSVLKKLREDPARIAFLARSLRRSVKSGEAIGRIRMRRLHVSYVMVEGTDGASLRKGPGHYPKTPMPGMPGTVGVAGHRTTYLAPFNKLDKVRSGDAIELQMPYALVKYRVERKQIVPPTALWVTKRVGYDRLVLTACHPKYSAAKRIVVFARQVSATPRGASARIR